MPLHHHLPILSAAALAVLPLGAAAQTAAPAPAATEAAAKPMADAPAITAPLKTAEGGELGQVSVAFAPSGMAVVHFKLAGVPEGGHAVHFHETGLCEGPKFESAGGHLADGKEHGVMSAGGPHPGDMPNLFVPPTGTQEVEYFVPGLTQALVQDADGTALIVHEKADDNVSQPSGEAGGRLACAVISPRTN